MIFNTSVDRLPFASTHISSFNFSREHCYGGLPSLGTSDVCWSILLLSQTNNQDPITTPQRQRHQAITHARLLDPFPNCMWTHQTLTTPYLTLPPSFSSVFIVHIPLTRRRHTMVLAARTSPDRLVYLVQLRRLFFHILSLTRRPGRWVEDLAASFSSFRVGVCHWRRAGRVFPWWCCSRGREALEA